jgi:hypothetical protein
VLPIDPPIHAIRISPSLGTPNLFLISSYLFLLINSGSFILSPLPSDPISPDLKKGIPFAVYSWACIRLPDLIFSISPNRAQFQIVGQPHSE